MKYILNYMYLNKTNTKNYILLNVHYTLYIYLKLKCFKMCTYNLPIQRNNINTIFI